MEHDRMKASEIRELEADELTTKISEMQRELVGIKVKRSFVGDEDDQPMRIRALRRDIARLKTVVRERELAK